MLGLWQPFIFLFLSASALSLVLTPFVRRLAWRLGVVDRPSSRRINRQPIPRMGGIAIYVSIIACILLDTIGFRLVGWPSLFGFGTLGSLGRNQELFLVGMSVVFLTGLLDDGFTLSPKQKLAGQVLGAVIAVSSGLVIDVIVNPVANTGIELGWVGYPITVVYLVAYTNIFNLIDGLDGLAAGIACIASVTMCVISAMAGHLDAAALSIILAGATLGFLRYNFNPASIFMGDSGSLLIGFVLGSISLMSVQRIAGLTSIIVPLVISGIPIIDTFSAIIRRGRAHVSIGQADKGHIHHRLMNEGLNQRQTVLFIYAWTTVLCIGSVMMTQVTVVPRIFIFCILIFSSVLFSWRLRLFRPVLLHHYNPETGTDELVDPQDPCFAEEEEKFDEEHSIF
ncbi:MAG: MraY family glycosyltransferase [Coriobacteriales bacterium]|nr:MraY family glycosyltransferase [Coriobacteriales bacterium]